MNRKRFAAPFLAKEDIEAEVNKGEVNKLSKQYPSLQKVPIDVLGFAEFDLELVFEFAPILQLGQEAFLRPDLTGIWFDARAFHEPSLHYRVRFSAAHELGHLFLHKRIYGSLEFTTIKQWIAFIESIPVAQYQWIESHANEFAGRFLMPTTLLQSALEEAIGDAEMEGYIEQGPEETLEFCACAIHKDFGVSIDAMKTRIRKSEFWPPEIFNNSN